MTPKILIRAIRVIRVIRDSDKGGKFVLKSPIGDLGANGEIPEISNHPQIIINYIKINILDIYKSIILRKNNYVFCIVHPSVKD